MLHAVIPMAGEGARFAKSGYDLPKPLVMMQGKPLFWWAATGVRSMLPLASLTVVVLRRHIAAHAIDDRVREYFPDARIVVLDQLLNGPVLTCLAGAAALPDDMPVLFHDCDLLFRSSALAAWARGLAAGSCEEGGLLTSFSADNPAFSYLVESAPGQVARTVEKQVVSRHAICGGYVFRNRTIFTDAATHYLDHCPYREFYMSGVYNSLIAQGHQVRHLALDRHLSFGTPEELAVAAGDPLLANYRGL
jgi:dTDP-glucose pyrophosphorylase